jgi:McrBC 5-methylcytosine restriction system component
MTCDASGRAGLRGTSISERRGSMTATAFVFDMNTIFEDFLTTALTEALEPIGGDVARHRPTTLDRDHQIRMEPDITWWKSGSCRAIIDAKYKSLLSSPVRNADAYQTLAYCMALVWAADFSSTQRTRQRLSRITTWCGTATMRFVFAPSISRDRRTKSSQRWRRSRTRSSHGPLRTPRQCFSSSTSCARRARSHLCATQTKTIGSGTVAESAA